MKKRVLCITLSLLMVVCIVPAQCYASTLRTWTPTIVYDLNGGTGDIASDSAPAMTYNIRSISVTDIIPERYGYQFLGWSRTPILISETQLLHEGDEVTFYSLLGLDKTVTLYAIWEEEEIPIVPVDPEDPEEPEDPDPVYYTVTFPYYAKDGDNDVTVTGSLNIPAGATIKVESDYIEGAKTYTLNGPMEIPAWTNEELQLANSGEDSTFDASKYVFKGFSYYYYEECDEELGTSELIYVFSGTWEGLSLDVYFMRHQYTCEPILDSISAHYGEEIEFDVNGGYYEESGASWDDSTPVYESFTVENPVKDGFIFDGWSVSEPFFFWNAAKLTAVWKRTAIDTDYKDCKQNYKCILHSYDDVSEYAWYHDGVHFCIENDILAEGVEPSCFCPTKKVIKEDLIVALYKLELEPEVSQEAIDNYLWTFSCSYEKPLAIVWAIDNGLLQGNEYGYNLMDTMTREEAATILYRYECLKLGVPAEIDFSVFEQFIDIDKVSAWSWQAMQWMSSSSILNGIAGRLNPQGDLTRAQLATVLLRVYELNQASSKILPSIE